jgi:FkbM family methyltransferase
VGLYTREALAAGARLVVAIEPAPENLACLRRNLASELAAGRLVLCPKGVWDRNDSLVLERAPGNSGHDRVLVGPTPGRNAPVVPLTTIDKLVRDLRLDRVDFIKMDIEGAEQRALAGARDTLARYRPRLAIAGYHRPDDPERLPALVLQASPAYRIQCGLCTEENSRIRPEVLFFH